MRRSVTAIIAVGVALSGLAAAPTASASPGDPAPGWPEFRDDVMYRDVDVSSSSRVFAVGLPDPEILDHSVLEHGIGQDWSSEDLPPEADGGVVAGPGAYAVAVTGNLSRVFDGTSWGEPVEIAPEIRESKLVGNRHGDAALLWKAGDGLSHLSRLVRGETWETGLVPGIPAGARSDVVINDAGKVTVIFAVRTGSTSEIRRTILQKESSTWSRVLRLGTVRAVRPTISLVTDGVGRETFVAGNDLWRQVRSTEQPTFQFRTSVRAKLAAGDTGTRLVWAVRSGGRYEIRTRFTGDRWRAEKVVWSRVAPLDPSCDKGIEFGVGMAPSGRAYVAVGIRHAIDDINLVCGGVEIADLLVVSGFDDVLSQRHLSDYANGGPFQVDAGLRGPVVVTYMYEDDGAGSGGEPPADGSWTMRFFSH